MGAESFTPWGAIAQVGGGLIQSIIGGIGAKKRQRELEKFNATAPKYQANQGIMDYYNQALARYNVNPTESALYKRQMQGIDRNVSNSINALQDRRSATAGASSLLRAANDARLDANVAAEQQRDQRFSQLGGAAEAKAGEERTAFDVNQMQPFERKFNLLAQRAGAANQLANTGISNAFGGLQNLSMIDAMRGSSGKGGFFNTAMGNKYKKTGGWPI